MAYFSQPELDAYIGSATTPEDYQRAEAYARARIEAYCQQIFESRMVTGEEISIEGVGPVLFAVKPVRSITSIVDQNGKAVTSYKPRPYGILLEANGVTKLTVAYEAGWPAVPEPIKRLALYLAKLVLVPLDKPTPAVASISSGGTSYTFVQANVEAGRLTGDDEMDAIANQYRRRWWAAG